MKKYIGKKVFSRFHKTGIVEDVIHSGDKYQLIIKFEDNVNPIKYGFYEAINDGLIWFVDSTIQEEANNKIKELENVDKRSKNKIDNKEDYKDKKETDLTAEKDINDFIKSQDREKIDIRANYGRIEILQKNYSYGTNGQEIYKKCCEPFMWDYSLKGRFASEKTMYATNVRDNYSVWMLPHSNFMGDRAKSGKWENYVAPPFIWEKYDNGVLPFIEGDKRITFVKMTNEVTKKAEYVFLGIYQSYLRMKSDDGKLVLKYQRISKEYPE